MNKQFSFLAACKDYFGQQPNQSPMQFGKEVLALSPEDKREIRAGLKEIGYDITGGETKENAVS